jgi:hypothetical protein
MSGAFAAACLSIGTFASYWAVAEPGPAPLQLLNCSLRVKEKVASTMRAGAAPRFRNVMSIAEPVICDDEAGSDGFWTVASILLASAISTLST